MGRNTSLGLLIALKGRVSSGVAADFRGEPTGRIGLDESREEVIVATDK